MQVSENTLFAAQPTLSVEALPEFPEFASEEQQPVAQSLELDVQNKCDLSFSIFFIIFNYSLFLYFLLYLFFKFVVWTKILLAVMFHSHLLYAHSLFYLLMCE